MGIWGTIVAIAAGIVSIGTAINLIFKGYMKSKSTAKEAIKREELLVTLPETLVRMEQKIDQTNDNVAYMGDKLELLDTQFLKYRISDAFHARKNIQDVPYEMLLGASQCGELYIAKGLNHETISQINIINKEIERRQRLRREGKDE